jgi:multidrug efflux pump subunit AcrA (membrane-fusion protein)
MKSSKWRGVFPMALFAGLIGCVSKGRPAPPTVEILEVEPADADIYVEFLGQTFARNMVDVRGRVEGHIEKWLFRPGQEVIAGQPLYILELSLAQRGALETATLNVEYVTIHAPISGLIGDTLAPVGGLVRPNAAQPLTTIAPLDPIYVRFKMSEGEFLSFVEKTCGPAEEGPKLELILSDNSVYPYAGQFVNLPNLADTRTSTLELQAEFPNPRHRLLPGRFGRVRYVTEHRAGVILVPQRAVQQNQKMQTVFTVGKGDKIQARVVRTGARIGDAWLIEQGLQPGDRVVVEGFLTVRPGVAVHPVPNLGKNASGELRNAN